MHEAALKVELRVCSVGNSNRICTEGAWIVCHVAASQSMSAILVSEAQDRK